MPAQGQMQIAIEGMKSLETIKHPLNLPRQRSAGPRQIAAIVNDQLDLAAGSRGFGKGSKGTASAHAGRIVTRLTGMTHSESSAAQDYGSPVDGAPGHVSRLVTAIYTTRPTTAIGRQRLTGQRPSPSPPALCPAAIQLATPPPSG